MFDKIITSNEIKFNDLERKIYEFVCYLGRIIIKLIIEKQDQNIMKNRDKKKYRHKGYRETSINTVMGEIRYKRAIYEITEGNIKKTVYLLDEQLQIQEDGKVSSNLVEKVIEMVPITDSYRKAEKAIDETTNTTLSHEKIRQVVLNVGDKITSKEKQEIKLLKKEQLIAGMKEITALFEEADGIWINLQGKDRKERIEKNKEKAKQQEKEFNPKMKVKTELKLHVIYEGWKKGDPRHSLVNKEYIAGIMKPKEMAALRDARVYHICEQLSRGIAKDGEGATKLLTCNVKNAKTLQDAKIVAKSVITSTLFKAAMFGRDANWGRILCAIGYSDADLDINKVSVTLASSAGDIHVCEKGMGVIFDEDKALKVLSEDEIDINIDLNDGMWDATAWGCDLTYDYVKINGEYRT